MIEYIKGDIFKHIENTKTKIAVPHVCNNIGAWGSGFVLNLSKQYKEPEIVYRRSEKLEMGTIQIVKVTEKIIIANMIAQRLKNAYEKHDIPLSYDALRICLHKLREECFMQDTWEIHCPKFGSGLARGNWNVIEQILIEVFSRKSIRETKIFVYEL